MGINTTPGPRPVGLGPKPPLQPLNFTTFLEITQQMWYAQTVTEEEKKKLATQIDKASILLQFRVEAEQRPLNKILLGIAGVVGIGVVIYFTLSGNYLATLLFWIAGATVGFTLYDKRKNPRDLTCKIRTEGVQVNNDLYPYDSLKSFWIFYDPPHHQELSLRSRAPLTGGYIKIPLGDADPVQIREMLLKFIHEKRQEEGLADALARTIGL